MAQRRERSADLGPEVAAAASALRALVDAWTLRALPLRQRRHAELLEPRQKVWPEKRFEGEGSRGR